MPGKNRFTPFPGVLLQYALPRLGKRGSKERGTQQVTLKDLDRVVVSNVLSGPASHVTAKLQILAEIGQRNSNLSRVIRQNADTAPFCEQAGMGERGSCRHHSTPSSHCLQHRQGIVSLARPNGKEDIRHREQLPDLFWSCLSPNP